MKLPLTALLLIGLAASATADAADPALGGAVAKPEANNVPYTRTDWMPAYSGDGGQSFHLKADSDSVRWRTGFR